MKVSDDRILSLLGNLRSHQVIRDLKVIPSLISEISDVIPELTEESGQDPIVEGVTFYVRYLGSCFVINKAGDEATSEAIKSIVSMVLTKNEEMQTFLITLNVPF